MENEILEELKQAGSEKTEQELRGVLGCFLFMDDDVFKKIKVLSGRREVTRGASENPDRRGQLPDLG